MRGALPVLTCLFVLAPATAMAAPTRQACVTAYEETQTSMRRSRLTQARASLQTCLDEACPSMLRTDCAGWLKEVEARMASVVVELVVDGAPVREAKLSIDGQAKSKELDGRAIEVDPGNHTFKVETAAGKEATLEAVVREGEKLKNVRLEIGSPKPPPPPPVAPAPVPAPAVHTSRPVPWPVFVAAGVSVVGLAGFGVFAAQGSSGKSDLDPCRPNCSEDRLSDLRSDFIAADVLLGVSVVALGAAAYFYFTRPTVTTSRTYGAAFAF